MKDPSRNLLNVDPALVETDAERLLLEWYEQWEDRADMPVKMANGLHTRTALYWTRKQAQQSVVNAALVLIEPSRCLNCGHGWGDHDNEIRVGFGSNIYYPEVDVVYECNHYAGMGNWCGCQEHSRRPLPVPRPAGFTVPV